MFDRCVHTQKQCTMEVKIVNTPTTLNKELNSIHLTWDNVLEEYNDRIEFLLFLEDIINWKALYRGRKTQYIVKGLTPSTVYNFKLKILSNNEELDSILFRAATDYEPYYVMHMTRAVTYNKTALLRKIASQRPILLETVDKENKTPLISAIERGDLQLVTFLVTLGANVNNPLLVTNRTPLMVALYHGHLQIATFLIDKGAIIDATDLNSLTGLHHAVDSGRFESVVFAIEHKFDVNARDSNGWTPLLRAIILEISGEIVELLIRNGADLKVRDNKGFGFQEHCELAKRYDWLDKDVEEIKHRKSE